MSLPFNETTPLARHRRVRTDSFPVYEIEPLTTTTDSSKNTAIDDARDQVNLRPERLEFESDLGHSNDIGTRLVDDPSHKHDFALWEEFLRYRQRHYGDEGVLEIWQGLMGRGIHLPVTGPLADLFWRHFVDVGLKRESYLEELANYALELYEMTGCRWDWFYEVVVGGFLRQGRAQHALEWHKRLQHPHLADPSDILRIIEPAISNKPSCYVPGLLVIRGKERRRLSPGVRVFQCICEMTEGHAIYGPVISKLLQYGYSVDALLTHRFLVKRGDQPRDYKELQPLLEYTEKYESDDDFRELEEYCAHRFGTDDTPDTLTEPSENDESSSPKQRPIMKDEFGAKLFATNALTFDIIVGGLQMFGVHAIGPLSLRELALRSHGCQDVLDKLNRLHEANISVGTSVYSRLMRKLAIEGRWMLLSELALSDQHPDAFEDAGLHESLLMQYYFAQDWQRYSMALAVLDLISSQGSEMFNIHFRKYIATGDWASATKLVDEMILHGKVPTDDSIHYMFQRVLSPRRRGTTPSVGRYGRENEVEVILRVLRRAVPAGVFVPPRLWVELLKRLGMACRWDGLEEACRWIVQTYSSDAQQGRILRAGDVEDEKSVMLGIHLPRRGAGQRMLRNIFSPHMQAAIVAWGFKMRISKRRTRGSGKEGIPWVRGLLLLRDLERKGVRLRKRDIQSVCRQRLKVLFGPPRLPPRYSRRRHTDRRSNRHSNQLLRRENAYDLYSVLADINHAWGGPLLSTTQVRSMDDDDDDDTTLITAQ